MAISSLDNDANAAVAVADLSGSGFVSTWQSIRAVAAQADGTRVFDSRTGLVITFGAEYQVGSKIAGTASELLLGIPNGKQSLTFNGGGQTSDGLGDTLRIVGDGDDRRASAEGSPFIKQGIYLPSETIPGGVG